MLAKVNLLHEWLNEPVLTVFIHLFVTVVIYQVYNIVFRKKKKKKLALIVRRFGHASTAALSQLLALHSPDPAGQEVMQECPVNIKTKQIKPSSIYPFSSAYPRLGHSGSRLSRVF